MHSEMAAANEDRSTCKQTQDKIQNAKHACMQADLAIQERPRDAAAIFAKRKSAKSTIRVNHVAYEPMYKAAPPHN